MKYQHRVLGMLSLLAVVTCVDRISIAVAGPRMQDDLGISPEAWAWVSSVFFLSYGAFEIPSGLLGDRIGPRKVLTRIVVWWSAFTSLTGTAASYGWRAAFFVFGVAGIAWAITWCAWLRDFPHEKPGVPQDELPEIGTAAPGHGRLPWGVALADKTFWRIAAIGACYVYVLSFFQSWLQTYLVRGRGYTEAALVLSSLRWGLKGGRRTVGVLGLSCAALFMAATAGTTSNLRALVFLSLSYAGIMLQQPNLCAVCLDTGRQHAGAALGFMNTACQIASVASSLAFGCIAGHTGDYNLPFVPMVLTLSIGTVLWMTIDPTHQVFEEQESLAA